VTATGDTVNVTSRLLEVAKQQGSSVVVSEDLYSAAKALQLTAVLCMNESMLEVNIRGRKTPLRVRLES
jgi:adenylate cyclase